ncbi:MAG: class I SAM-dependent methyltransferase [Actinomycetota bacterium]|nr:class I SAM-dependent methyltransferase [Actinomycetota bacterium]
MSEKDDSGKGNIAAGATREAKVGAWWSAQAKRREREESPRLDWLCSPVVQEIISRKFSEEEEINWIGFVKKKLIDKPLDLGLSIGCGTGDLERDVVAHVICRKIEAVDIAEGALEIARRQASDLPIKYIQGDLETMNFPPNNYDIAFCSATLHHINKLDHCLSQIHNSLKKEGLFALFEYIGPSRFQWEPYQLRLVNDVYALLPEEYHLNRDSGIILASVTRPGIAFMIQNDPSEAVRAHDILEVADRYFETLYRIDLGGTLLNPLLGGICESFDDNDEMDSSFLRLVALLEESLTKAGFLSPCFVVMGYRRRENPLGGAETQREERERSETISRQEAEITSLCQRLSEAGTEVEKPLERLDEKKTRLEVLARAIEKQQLKNLELKKGFLFRVVRAARRILRGERLGEKVEENVQSPVCEGKTQAEAGESYVSPEVRAVKSCLGESGPDSEYLWLHWVRELIGTSSGKALLTPP